MSMMTSIVKLKGRENYVEWKFSVQAFLQLEGIWDVVDDTIKPEDESKRAEWDVKAKSRLILLVEPINFVHIQSAKTAKEVWDNLKRAFDDSGLLRRVGLLRVLITTKLENCSSMEDYVNKIVSTAHTLNGAGMQINDEWIATLLLAGLSERYEPMIMAIENGGVAISSDQIKTKLLQEMRSNTDVGCGSGGLGDTAMFTKKTHGKHRKQHYSQSHTDKKPLKCFECHMEGHFARNCPNRKTRSDNNKNHSSFTCFVAGGSSTENDWFVDSGASTHMTHNKNNLVNFRLAEKGDVKIANNERLSAGGVGDLELSVVRDDRAVNTHVKNVLYVPNLCANLLSVSQMVRQGLNVNFSKDTCRIMRGRDECVGTADLVNGVYKLNVKCDDSSLLVKSEDLQMLWHRRFGHVNFHSLNRMQSDIVSGISFKNNSDRSCEVCVKGKHSRKPFRDNKTISTNLLEIIHSDVCGPMPVNSYGGSRYFVTFIDDYSRKVFVATIKKKSEVFEKFVEFKQFVENQTDKKVKILRSDNGTEYLSNVFVKFLSDSGIQHQRCAPYTPQQNGLAERMNRTLVEKARCMMFDSKLNSRFWAEAVCCAAYLVNRSLSKGLSDKCPEEAWSGKRPDVSNLRLFGCKAMVHVPAEKRKKWDAKSIECVMIGYTSQSQTYRLFDPEKQSTIVSRDVIFLEDRLHEKVKYDNFNFEFAPEVLEVPEVRGSIIDNVVERVIDDNSQQGSELEPVSESVLESVTESVEDNSFDASVDSEEPFLGFGEEDIVGRTESLPTNAEPLLRRSKRVFERNALVSRVETKPYEPATLEDALSGTYAGQWRKAIDEEYRSLSDNKTWSLVNLPEGRQAINCMWVFKLKCDANGTINRFKARLVAKGCAQRKGMDYNETYSPVVRYTSIRFLIAMAVHYNLEIDQMDAVTAFLQGKLTEDIYMKQPKLFEDGTSRVCRLNKSIYGLKQASRVWNMELDSVLKEFGLKCSKHDTCIYFLVKDKLILVVAVYVDDLIIFSNDATQTKKIKQHLSDRFKMKDLGLAKYILGMEIIRNDNGSISIHQGRYIKDVLERFNMTNCKSVTTPADVSQKLTSEMCPKDESERKSMENVPYQEAVGSLLYAAQVSRPDIQFAVGSVSRFNNNPGPVHWMAVKRIMRYLKGTVERQLNFNKDKDSSRIRGFCDADWASDAIDRRSTTGYVFLAGTSAISWNSKKQPTVALSTTEAEYMAMSAATQEAVWLQNLQSEIFDKRDRIYVFSDNQGAIQLSEKEGYHPRTKHIDIRHHYVKEKVFDQTIKFEYVNTSEMVADFLTKAVNSDKTTFCCKGVNLV